MWTLTFPTLIRPKTVRLLIQAVNRFPCSKQIIEKGVQEYQNENDTSI